MSARKAVSIPLDRVFYRIGDVARIVGVKTHVLRFWESEFAVVSPPKSKSGQRVYRRTDVEHVLLIKHLLYTERFSIEGARRRIRDLRRAGELPATLGLALQALPGWVSTWNQVSPASTAGDTQIPNSSWESSSFEASLVGLSDEEALLVHARRLLELSERPIAEFFSY